MLLLFMAVSSVFSGSSADVKHVYKCYGSSLYSSLDYTPPIFNGQLYLTPSNGGPRKLMMDRGESKEPRFTFSYGSIRLSDLRDGDDGTFSISYGDNRLYDVIRLTIEDCSEKITKYYGDMYNCDIPKRAKFLEFTPLHSPNRPQVLWNHTDPETNKGGRGRVNRNTWQIRDLTQADNGYYSFRKDDNTLQSRIQLIVEERTEHLVTKVNEEVLVQYPSGITPISWTLTFKPDGEMEHVTLIDAKSKGIVRPGPFRGRIYSMRNGIEIDPVESTDSGTFDFRDQQGNLAFTMRVNVIEESTPIYMYVVAIVVIMFVVMICCCCMRKCCCKKSSSKRSNSPPQAATTTAVHYYDTHQPTRPNYSAAPSTSASAVNLPVSTKPTTTSLGPSVTVPVGPRAAPAPSVGCDLLSSDPEPKFDLKGQTFPLSSDSTYCDVYNSDKLNFL